MTLEQWISAIPGLGALIVSLVVALSNARRDKQAGRNLAATTAVEGLSTLCDHLGKRLEATERELAALRAEQAQLRTENEGLRRQIRELEDVRDRLEAQIAALEKQMGRRGKRRSEEAIVVG